MSFSRPTWILLKFMFFLFVFGLLGQVFILVASRQSLPEQRKFSLQNSTDRLLEVRRSTGGFEPPISYLSYDVVEDFTMLLEPGMRREVNLVDYKGYEYDVRVVNSTQSLFKLHFQSAKSDMLDFKEQGIVASSLMDGAKEALPTPPGYIKAMNEVSGAAAYVLF